MHRTAVSIYPESQRQTPNASLDRSDHPDARRGSAPSLAGGLAVASEIQVEFRLDSLQPQISALFRALPDRHIVNVAVVGRFKAGKSSFLNEIVGRDVLPVDVLPATSVITQVSYGPVDRVAVRFLDGRVEPLCFEQLPWEVEKNLTRFAWQWTDAANTTIEGIGRQAEEFMNQEAATVIELTTSTKGKRERVTAALARLDEINARGGRHE